MQKRAAYYGLAVVTILNFLNYIDRYILAAVLPRMQSELQLTNAQAGLLATAFLLAYFITSPIFGAGVIVFREHGSWQLVLVHGVSRRRRRASCAALGNS
jgi:MFS family permease